MVHALRRSKCSRGSVRARSARPDDRPLKCAMRTVHMLLAFSHERATLTGCLRTLRMLLVRAHPQGAAYPQRISVP